MNRRFIITAAIAAIFAGSPFAQVAVAADPPISVVWPVAWTTLRSDSVTVSVLADTSRLPRNSVDFKVVRRTGTRSQTLFTKRVDIDGPSVESFLGRVRDVPVGGSDYISIEWSVVGASDNGGSGSVEPVGIAKLNGAVVDNKWVPAQTPLRAVRLGDGPIDSAALSPALAGAAEANGFDVGGVRYTAGWNKEGLAIRFVPRGSSAIEFAFDPKCGKNAFLAWADRFVVYDVKGDSVSGLHYSDRSVEGSGMTRQGRTWGRQNMLNLVKNEDGARVITVRWHELGLQPFDGRNIGFAVFSGGNARQPAAARRELPGTWGDIRLEK